MLTQSIKKLEALLFAWGDALSYQKLSHLTGATIEDVKKDIASLNHHYLTQDHSIEIIEINQSVQIVTRHIYGDLVEQLFATDKNKGLSTSNLEVLSIVAYKQPITKTEIERIRGVKCDRAIQILIELGLIRISGQLERIGRPNLFSTTDVFLKKFGLKTLRDLPPVASFDKMQLALFDEEEDGYVEDNTEITHQTKQENHDIDESQKENDSTNV